MNLKVHNPVSSILTPHVIDSADWLKTSAIFMVAVGHFGYFFIEDADWWSVVGRMAAPVFFFLMGYARSRTIPLRWIWLGIILTLLDSWNTGWTWVAPNILFSMVLIRIARPYAKTFLQSYGWVAFVTIVSALLVALPTAANIVDYGAEGWLWALFGLCQRMYVESQSPDKLIGITQCPAPHAHSMTPGSRRLLACIIAATVYVWQEQIEFLFSQVQFATILVGVGILSLTLCQFRRGPSRLQPPEPIAGALHFTGRHTLEIYVFQLAGSEIIIGLLPDLAA